MSRKTTCDKCGQHVTLGICGQGFAMCKKCGDDEPAHTVPFAYAPDKTVVERFTVEIQTPESPEYCGCPRCRKAIADFWRVYISNLLQRHLNDSDPLRVFPHKHEITVQ